MDLIGIKVISGCLFFFLSLLFGWLPFYLHRRFVAPPLKSPTAKNCTQNSDDDHNDKNKVTSLISYLHSFASGVLVAICLLHLLPGSQDAVRKEMKYYKNVAVKTSKPKQNVSKQLQSTTSNDTNQSYISSLSSSTTIVTDKTAEGVVFYPVAELVIAIGFIFIYIVDSTIKTLSKTTENGNNTVKRLGEGRIRYVKVQTDSSSDSDEECYNENYKDNKEIAKTSGETVSFDFTDASCPDTSDNENNTVNFSSISSQDMRIPDSDLNKDINSSHLLCELNNNNQSDSETNQDADGRALTNSQERQQLLKSSSDNTKDRSVDIRSLGLVMALCVHGFFDGVMLGLQTSLPVILPLLIALSIHKIFVSISLSLTLAKNFSFVVTTTSSKQQITTSKREGGYNNNNNNNSNDNYNYTTRYFLYIVSFASVAPLGLITSAAILHNGWSDAVNNNAPNSDVTMAAGLLQSFAVGTFLYVTFTEMSERHDESKSTMASEVLHHVLLLVGFSMMAGLRAAFGDT